MIFYSCFWDCGINRLPLFLGFISQLALMVAVMRSLSGKAKVKSEVDDEDPVEAGEHQQLSPPPHKRTKLFPGLKRDGGIVEVVAEYHPLKELSPLGLRLKKSPSFLELVRVTLSQENSSNDKGSSSSSSSSAADKLKASNFPASVLKIGTWEYKSRYEGDLVAKCYFAKHKLVWEVLDGALKNKIEIQWSDVVAIKANYGVEGMDTLDVVLARQPLFFRETNPQPRKHTLWQPTSDFTCGQASIYRHHFLQCQQGLLGRHFEKLVQCDPRLNFLSEQQKFVVDSLHFESKDPSFGDHGVSLLGPELNSEKSSFLLSLPDEVASSSGSLCNNLNKMEDFPRTAPDDYTRKAASPSSVTDTRAIEDIEHSGLRRCPPIKAPDVASSMSISNMVVHISHCISEQSTPSIPFLPSVGPSERDVPHVGTTGPIRKRHQLMDTSRASTGVKNNSGREKGQGMRRKDSVGELLVNLPRIASLPQILPNTDEDARQYLQNRW